jgi:hypothetical protein
MVAGHEPLKQFLVNNLTHLHRIMVIFRRLFPLVRRFKVTTDPDDETEESSFQSFAKR